MGLESATYISQLVATNPVGGVDDYATADDHLRLIKAVLQGQFPNFTAVAMNATVAELNTLDGITSTTAELNKLDGFTGLPADLNVLSGADAAGLTAAELLFVNGVTSALQAQIDGKAASSHTHGTADIDNDAITYAKIQNVVADERLLGNIAGAGGIVTELTVAQVLTMLSVEAGATADQTAGEIEAIVSHDNLQAIPANDHIDWTVTGAEDVHADRFANLPVTSETVQGIVERANQAEVDAGTDTTRYVSPATLRSADTDQLVILAADETATNDVTLSMTADLNYSGLSSAVHYALEGCLYVHSASATPGFKMSFNVSGGTITGSGYMMLASEETVGWQTALEQAVAITATPSHGLTAGNEWRILIKGHFINSAGGNLQLTWAQFVSNGTPTTLKKGSWLRLTKV